MRCPCCGTPIGEPVGVEERDGCDARAHGPATVTWACLVIGFIAAAGLLIWAALAAGGAL